MPLQKFKVWQLEMTWLPYWKGRIGMFNFRIIPCADGTEIIDMALKTPFNSLTPSQMEDYIEMDKQLAYMERIKEREQKQAERKRRRKNPLYGIVCRLGGRQG